MKELLAFLLPPATAFVGMRLCQWFLGKKLAENFGFGLRFALGLGIGMVVFSQSILLTVLIGIDASALLAWVALLWGAVEVALQFSKIAPAIKLFRPQRGHLWLLLLLPVLYSWWVFGRLSTLEGTLEFDANAFWVFKAKIMYLKQGKDFLTVIHQSNLGYAHMDYPMLVPALYTMTYGLMGQVWEFTNKVWPFWMVVTLCIGILSLARTWHRPKPLAVVTVLLFCFLPATISFIRQEGGTIPMVFCTSLAAMLFAVAFSYADKIALCAGILVLAECSNTKFEGVIYTALWGTVVVVFCWRRGWLSSRLLWKTIVIAAILMVPYAAFRINKPVTHPESGWLHDGAKSPSTVIRRFPQTFSLNVSHRFFSKEFYHWTTPDKDHVQYDGKWVGLKSLSNPELSVLPWLTLVMVVLTLWKKRQQRLALGALLLVIGGQIAILSLVISCLNTMQADVSNVLSFVSDVVGRYSYPFFTACFLGTMALWIADRAPVAVLVPAPEKSLPTTTPAQKTHPKNRR